MNYVEQNYYEAMRLEIQPCPFAGLLPDIIIKSLLFRNFRQSF